MIIKLLLLVLEIIGNNGDTIGNVRVDYLYRMQCVYESGINRMQNTITNSKNSREVSPATRHKEKLQKQLKECMGI